MVAKERLSVTFTKKEAIIELEKYHGTDLESGYKNDHSCTMFLSV